MFNSKMIGANSAGAPQPPGTGALLITGANGMYISVDDGLTWSNNAFTGIDPTNGFNKEVVWNGSAFVAFQTGGKLFTSPDGYNWTETYSNGSYPDILGMSVDQVSGEIIAIPYKYNVSYVMLRSLDNGNTWTVQGGPWSSSSYGAYVQGVAVHNGYAVVSGRTGNWRRSGVNNSWGWTNTSLGTQGYPVYNNGVWSCVEGADYTKIFSSTSATPGYIKDWTQSGGSGLYLQGVNKTAIDGVDKNVFYAQVSGKFRLYLSYDKGLNFSVAGWNTSTYSAVGYHNGKFYFNRDNELWTWTNPPFGSQVKVTDLSLQCANFASMSFPQ